MENKAPASPAAQRELSLTSNLFMQSLGYTNDPFIKINKAPFLCEDTPSQHKTHSSMPGIKEHWCYIMSLCTINMFHTHKGREVALVVFSLWQKSAHYKNLTMQENSLHETLTEGVNHFLIMISCGFRVWCNFTASHITDSHTHVFSCVVHFPLTSPTREEKEGGRFKREGKDRQKEREESVRRNKVKVPRKWTNGRVF